MVEQVKKLKPKLEIYPFRYVSVLVRRQVGFGEARLAELSGLLVAVRTRRRSRKL